MYYIHVDYNYNKHVLYRFNPMKSNHRDGLADI